MNPIVDIELVQLDLSFDNGQAVQLNSEWGYADLTFHGIPSILYFNLIFNDDWVVKNAPVPSIEGPQEQTQTFAIDIGVTSGEPLAFASFGLELTDFVLSGPPIQDQTTTVSSDDVIFSSGEEGVQIGLPSAPQPFDGGEAVPIRKQDAAVTHTNDDGFLNQEAGLSECAPVAYSNSLRWLNQKHNLGMNAADISIDALKGAVNWTAASAAPANHFRLKAAYIRNKKLPVSTRVVKNVNRIGTFIDRDCDVELDVVGHVAAVVGLTKIKNGLFALQVKHDTKQGMAGGTKTEHIIYNPASNTVIGGTWLNGVMVDGFVVECPK